MHEIYLPYRGSAQLDVPRLYLSASSQHHLNHHPWRSIASRLFIATCHAQTRLLYLNITHSIRATEMSSPTDQTPGMSIGGGGERRRVSPSLSHCTTSTTAFSSYPASAVDSAYSCSRAPQSSASATKFAGLMDQKRNPGDVTAAARKASFAEQNNKPGVFGSMWQK